MQTSSGHGKRRATATLAAALVAILALVASAIVSSPAGAIPQSISGDATVAIGLADTEVGVPETSTFTGTLDADAGTISVDVANTEMEMSFPLGDDDAGFSGTFSNPGGFSGTVSGADVELSGTARFKLTGITIPGFEVPPLLAFLPCHFDFEPEFVGTYDAVAGEIDASDDSIVVPQLPALCAGAIDLALTELGVDIGVNDLIESLPPASATLTLSFAEPLVTTTTSTSTTTLAATTTTAAPTDESTTTTSVDSLPVLPTEPDATSSTTQPQSQVGAADARTDRGAHAQAATAVRGTPTYIG